MKKPSGLFKKRNKTKHKVVFYHRLALKETDEYFITSSQGSPLLPKHRTLQGAVTSSCESKAAICRIN